jgi:hypothetical protein
MTRHHVRYCLPLLAALSLSLSGCSGEDSGPSAGSRSDSPSTRAPAAETSPSSPMSLRDYEGDITPGSHRVPLISWERTYPVDALVDVPEGFITPGGWVVDNSKNGAAYGDLMFFGDIDWVDTNPCGAGREVKPGPSVRDLADALSAQVPHPWTSPRPVTVGGHHGLYLESSGPNDVHQCDHGQFRLWTVDQTHAFWYSADEPGTVFHLWILDVDGQRVVDAVKVIPGRTVKADELVHMGESAEFVENVDATVSRRTEARTTAAYGSSRRK